MEATDISEKPQQQSGKQDMESSRRHFLQTLGLLSTEFLLPPPMQGSSSFLEGHPPDFSQASVANLATITHEFRAMQRRGNTLIAYGVNAHLQTIQEALEQTVNDRIRQELWRVLAQTQTVAAFNPLKKTERGRAKTWLEAAVASARLSGDALLLGASLGHLAQFTLRQEDNIPKTGELLSHAQEHVPPAHPLHGWFALVMAALAAKRGDKHLCEEALTKALTLAHHLSQAPERADLYFTDFSLTSVHIFAIHCWLTIGNAINAYTHVTEVDLDELADNRRASAFCDASNVYAMMDECELAQHFAFRAIDKAVSTQQYYVIPRCLALAQTMQQKMPEKRYATAITDYVRLVIQQN